MFHMNNECHVLTIFVCPFSSSQDRKSILFINVCKWIRVPKPKTDNDPIPVKGGVLRHVIDTHTRKKSRDLVVDVAFNPYVLDECLQDCVMESMLVSLCQNFVEDVTQLKIQDRKKCTKVQCTCSLHVNLYTCIYMHVHV